MGQDEVFIYRGGGGQGEGKVRGRGRKILGGGAGGEDHVRRLGELGTERDFLAGLLGGRQGSGRWRKPGVEWISQQVV